MNGINKYRSSEICDEFANYFSKIGANLAKNTAPSVKDINTYLRRIPVNKLSIFLAPCSKIEIKKIILGLKQKKSSGYDKINSILLCELTDTLVLPLELIFNQLLSQGIFPDFMKLAELVPLYKKGNPHQTENYRPISLLITLSKVLETIIYSHVYTFLNESGQIFRSQYGFRSKHSCEHAIADLVGNIVKEKEKNEHTIAIFLDLS